MSDLKDFKTNSTHDLTSFVEDNATSTGNATVIINATAVNHLLIKITTSKDSPNTNLYTKMPAGTFQGQLCSVVVFNQLYGNHTINLINTNDVSLGSGQTGTIWHLTYVGTKWKVIRQFNNEGE
jgi:hypothetical protein